MRCLAALAVLALAAGCAQAPPPVHFFDSGRPERLDQWHVVYAQGSRLLLNARVLPYDLNTPLFSDYTHKLRTLWMPPGSAAHYDPQRSFEFPVGTIISKTFYYPLPAGGTAAAAGAQAVAVARTYDTSRDYAGAGLDLTRVRLIETRLLVRRQAGWEALPYVWNARQTEAVLRRTGDVQSLRLVGDDGVAEDLSYVVPNENQCAGCHVTDLGTKQLLPLGLKARHLNRDYDYADGARNQLVELSRLGLLTGAPDPDKAPRNASWRDPRAPVAARARAYLDANCGHCHNPTGAANTTGLDLDIASPDDRHLGICKPPVAAGRASGDAFYDIVPGQPGQSILPYRMASKETGVMMPEQGRGVVHREGVELIRAWITAMPGGCGV